MIVSEAMEKLIEDQEGWTRKMFEAAIEMKRTYGLDNVYDFSLGNPNVEPPPALLKRLIEMLSDPTPGLHRYMPNNGYDDVRERIASYLSAHYSLPFTAQHVFM